MRRTLLALTLPLLALALSACGDDADKTGLSHPGLTVGEVLQRSAKAMGEVTSLRLDEHSEAPTMAGGVTDTVHIWSGDDEYFYEEGPDGVTEKLTYGGEEYFRSGPADEWTLPEIVDDMITASVTSDSVIVHTVDSATFPYSTPLAETPTPPPYDPSLDISPYGVDLNGFAGAKRLPDGEIDGRRCIRLRVGTGPPAAEPSSTPTGEVDQLRKRIEEVASALPYELTYSATLWIGADDFLVYRLAGEFGDYREKAGYVFTWSSDYSQHDSAELPGPLPD